MQVLQIAEDFRIVSNVEDGRGAQIQARLDALGISDREFMERSGIDRKTLRRAVLNDPKVRANTYKLIEDWLDATEASHAGPAQAVTSSQPIIVRGVTPGGIEFAVEGPVDNPDAIAAVVERLVQGHHES